MALGVDFQHGRFEGGRIFVFAEDLNFHAQPGPFSGAQQGPPVVGRVFFQQQQLEMTVGPGIAPAQPRRDDARIVQNEKIAGGEILRQVEKAPMRDLTRGAVQDQQPRLIASGGRGLGDQFGRQRVIKVGGPHAKDKFKVQPYFAKASVIVENKEDAMAGKVISKFFRSFSFFSLA